MSSNEAIARMLRELYEEYDEQATLHRIRRITADRRNFHPGTGYGHDAAIRDCSIQHAVRCAHGRAAMEDWREQLSACREAAAQGDFKATKNRLFLAVEGQWTQAEREAATTFHSLGALLAQRIHKEVVADSSHKSLSEGFGLSARGSIESPATARPSKMEGQWKLFTAEQWVRIWGMGELLLALRTDR